MNSVKIENTGEYIRVSGNVSTWEEAIKICFEQSTRYSNIHVVNDLVVDGLDMQPTILPRVTDTTLDGKEVDVLIVGGGIVGAAILRELSRYKLNVLLIEKEYDLALHASSRNAGMVHPGIDLKEGCKKRTYNTIGNQMYEELCADLNVPFRMCPQYLCIKEWWVKPFLKKKLKALDESVCGNARLLTYKELVKKEPWVSPNVRYAIEFDGTGIVSPYMMTIALAENAVENGGKVSLDTALLRMEVVNSSILSVTTNKGTLKPKVVINAAGVFSEEVAAMAQDRFFSIHPRRGNISILDTKYKKYVNDLYSLLPIKGQAKNSKGGGLVSTVDGNILVGPNAVETHEKENFATIKEDVAEVFGKHGQVADWLSYNEIITYFTGIRAATFEEDFIIEMGRNTKNLVHAAGIQSPGITAAPAIGIEIAKLTTAYLSQNQVVEKNHGFNPKRKGIKLLKECSFEERDAMIKKNPAYGEIVCRCEEISKGEIVDAINSVIPCNTLDGIKRRVRAGMGRCQGGFCGQQVLQIISEETNVPLTDVKKGYPNSNILLREKGGYYE